MLIKEQVKFFYVIYKGRKKNPCHDSWTLSSSLNYFDYSKKRGLVLLLFLEKDFGGHQTFCSTQASASSEKVQPGPRKVWVSHLIRPVILSSYSLGISNDSQSFGGCKSQDQVCFSPPYFLAFYLNIMTKC